MAANASSVDHFITLQFGYAHRTESARHVSLLPLLQMLLLQLARSVCGASSACCSPWPSPVVPRHCYPLTAVLSPPPPKYSGNEEGAKMTGSISDFAGRTCASTIMPRELALGAGSSGMIRVSTATSSSAASARAIGRGTRARRPKRRCQNDDLDIRRSEPRAPCQALLPIRCCPCRCHSRARTLRLLHSQVSV